MNISMDVLDVLQSAMADVCFENRIVLHANISKDGVITLGVGWGSGREDDIVNAQTFAHNLINACNYVNWFNKLNVVLDTSHKGKISKKRADIIKDYIAGEIISDDSRCRCTTINLIGGRYYVNV